MEEKWEIFRRELSSVQDEELKEFCKTLLNAAPEYFWRMGASSSGKYHPADDLATGGLVHHTKKVVYFAKELCEAMNLMAFKDIAVVAAILHDIVKYGVNGFVSGGDDWQQHGPNVRVLVEKVYGKKVEETFQGEMLKKVQKVLRLCATHFGKWGKEENHPKNKGEWLLHLADYIASRKLVVIEEGL